MPDYGVRFNDAGIVTIPSWSSGSGDFTVRVRFQTGAIGALEALFGTQEAAFSDNYFVVKDDGGYQLRVGGSTLKDTGTGTFSANTNYQLFMERTGTTLVIQISAEDGTLIIDTTSNTSNSLTITALGSANSTPLYYNGIIWETLFIGGTQDRLYKSTVNVQDNLEEQTNGQTGTLSSLGTNAEKWVEDTTTYAGSGPSGGTITTSPLRNNTGTLLSNLTGVTVDVYDPMNGALLTRVTNQTTDSNGVCSVSDASILVASSYRVVVNTSGTAEGIERLTAT